jgi:hypothetical protein
MTDVPRKCKVCGVLGHHERLHTKAELLKTLEQCKVKVVRTNDKEDIEYGDMDQQLSPEQMEQVS